MLLGDPLLTSSLYIVAGYLTAYFFFWVFAYSNDKWCVLPWSARLNVECMFSDSGCALHDFHVSQVPANNSHLLHVSHYLLRL